MNQQGNLRCSVQITDFCTNLDLYVITERNNSISFKLYYFELKAVVNQTDTEVANIFLLNQQVTKYFESKLKISVQF